jgi:hypothetical protein
MGRDFTKYPDDENGDVLYRICQSGDDLEIIREIDFSVVFPTEDAALKFGEILLFNRQKVSLSDYEENGDYPYDITVHVHMKPTHKEITDFEALLEKYATKYDGYNDGWGCYEQK